MILAVITLVCDTALPVFLAILTALSSTVSFLPCLIFFSASAIDFAISLTVSTTFLAFFPNNAAPPPVTRPLPPNVTGAKAVPIAVAPTPIAPSASDPILSAASSGAIAAVP